MRNLLGLLCFVVIVRHAVLETQCKGAENCSRSNENETPYEVITVIPEPIAKPESLSMVEDEESIFRPTAITSTQEEPKGRSLNFTIDEHTHNNDLSKNVTNSNGTKKKMIDLSDVDMGNDDDDDDMGDMEDAEDIMKDSKIIKHGNKTISVCEKGGFTYENGEKLEVGCDSVCTCSNGKMDCVDRCSSPYFKKGKKIDDPLCTEQPAPEDSCCVILSCADTATEAIEFCSYKNKTYNRGETIRDDCEQVCHCAMGGKISCKDRCESPKKISDSCVQVPDPEDHCCKKVLCDVNHAKYKITSAMYVNDSTVKVEFDTEPEDMHTLVDLSNDKQNWTTFTLISGDYLHGIDRDVKYIRLENEDDITEIQNLPKQKTTTSQPAANGYCSFNGIKYKLGDEFNDGCKALCVCKDSGVKCLKLECPTYFGTDIIDPHCTEWETVPANFTAVHPKCCPDKLTCKNNGSCLYEGVQYNNFEEIPTNLTGCEKRCYCEMGNVECQNICAHVPAVPPRSLPCPPHLASLQHRPGDDCCLEWMCQQIGLPPGIGFPPGFPNIPGFPPAQSQDEIIIQSLDAVSPYTVKLAFEIPHIIVGLFGRVEVRYTHTKEKDPSNWEQQVFAPPEDLLATPQLEFELTDLMPDTTYQIKVSVSLRDMHNTPSSKIYEVRTMRGPPKMIPIEPNLSISEVNSSWAVVSWRKFTDNELQFIDGVQLRYKVLDGKIFDATTLIHRAVTSYMLENLNPQTTYEVGIYFIPFTNQKTELRSENMIHFTTNSEMDTYGFNVSLEILQVKPTSVEISWKGVPYPEDKYVNIYRAIYQSDSGKGDFSTFKVAKREAPSKTVIMDLKPGTRYRLWLEVYLTNGRIKTSNVQDFITKPGLAPVLGASARDKLSGELSDEDRGDYYGPLVIVAILATLAILSTLVLLLILVKRHGTNKACITPPARVSQSAYDNPTYKVEIQQETMGL